MTYRFTKNATDESKLTCVWSHFEGGCMKKNLFTQVLVTNYIKCTLWKCFHLL